MNNKNFTLTGKVIRKQSQDPIKGLRVEAWDNDIFFDDFVGSAETDENGDFNIVFSSPFFQEWLTDKNPDLYFKIFSEKKLILNTCDNIIWQAGRQTQGIVIEVDLEEGNEPLLKSNYSVRGTVTDVQGQGLADLIVRAYDVDLRSEELLGKVKTNAEGKYEIEYSRNHFKRTEKRNADLAIKVFGYDGQELLHAPSLDEVRFNAEKRIRVNITIDAEISPHIDEFTTTVKTLRSIIGGTNIVDLEESDDNKDISFLTRETGIDNLQLQHFVLAHRLYDQTNIPAAFYYALFRLDTLLSNDVREPLNFRFRIDLNSKADLLFYDIVLLEAEALARDLNEAVTLKIIPSISTDELKAINKELAENKEKAKNYQENEKKRLSLEMITNLVTSDKLPEIAKRISEQPFNINALFDLLEEGDLFKTTNSIDQAKASVALADILGFDTDIISSVSEAQGITKPEDVSTLAALSHEEWSDMLTTSASTIRLGGRSMNPDLIDRHASKLALRFEKKYPTIAYAGHLNREQNPRLENHDRVRSILSEHRDFKLDSTRIDSFFKEKEIDSEENQGAKKELKQLQRVFKLVPNYSKTNALIEKGMNSSHKIVSTGKSRFLNEIAPASGLTNKEAREVFARAENITTTSMMMVGEVQEMLSDTKIAALESTSAPALLEAVSEDFPDLKTLFAQADMCSCEHCRSVYSPAAYLVELLEFLDRRTVIDLSVSPSVSGYLAKNVLFNRRPDIGDLDLNCANATTPLPYIDLVCEILEQAVHPDLGVALNAVVAEGVITVDILNQLQAAGLPVTDDAVIYEPDSHGNYILRDEDLVCKFVNQGAPNDYLVFRLRQTFGSAEELAAAPEYVSTEAYDRLAAAEYAFALPFNLNHVESLAYFSRFDMSRAKLMDDFKAPGTPTDPSSQEIAAEKLGLTPIEHDLIKAPQLAKQEDYWNLSAASLLIDMAVVDTMLTKTGLSYEELQILLQLSFIDPDDDLFIRHEDLSCDTTKKFVENLDRAALDRIHRFIRIRNKTGWSLELQDQLLTQAKLGNNSLDGDGLVHTSNLIKIQEASGMKLEQLVGCYGEIPFQTFDDSDYIPLYHSIFLNKAANGVIDEALFTSNLPPEKVGSPDPLSGDVLTSIATALQISSEDLISLISALGLTELTYSSLSALYGHSLLSSKLSISVSDLLLLMELTQIDVFDSTSNTLEFVELVIEARQSPLNVETMQFMLKHAADDLSAVDISEDRIIEILTELQTGFQELFSTTRSAFDSELESEELLAPLKEALQSLPEIDEETANEIVDIASGDFNSPAANAAIFTDNLESYFDTANAVAAQNHLATTALAAADYDPEADRMNIIQEILEGIANYNFKEGKSALLTEVAMSAFNAEEELTNTIITNAQVKQLAAVEKSVKTILMSDALIDIVNEVPVAPAINLAGFGDQFAAIKLLHKLFPLAASLDLEDYQLTWLLTSTEVLGWLSLDGIPYDSGMTELDYQDWLNLLAFVNRQKELSPVEDPADATNPITYENLMSLLDPVLGSAMSDWLDMLAKLTGYDRQQLEDLDTRFGYSNPDLGDYLIADTWDQIDAQMGALQTLGVNVSEVVEFIKPSLNADDTLALRMALKARYSESTWLTTLTEIMDSIRPQKRDALVAFLLAVNAEMNEANDLYDYFLVDTQMESCMPSSRIVQAHGVIQLFVQRCLLGIEPSAAADVESDAGWDQWQWMRMYRVWEANRKVFVYPENWIEPELLTDKSYLFSDLENELLQNELNEFTTEDAITNYLEKLDDIAFLEVVACCYEEELYTMHVFARTKGGDPAQYFYRTFENERYWTPWQKVDLDITSDHLLAFKRNGRMHLAWPVISEESDPDQEVTTPAVSTSEGSPQTMDTPHLRSKIQIAISEFANGIWKPKKISQEAIYTPSDYSTAYIDPKYFTFVYDQQEDRISVFHTFWPDYYSLDGHFLLNGCKGYPELIEAATDKYYDFYPDFEQTILQVQRYIFYESKEKPEGLALRTTFSLFYFVDRLNKTPNGYKVTYPHQFSVIDLIGMYFQVIVQGWLGDRFDRVGVKLPLGTGMPYFVEDSNFAYSVIPGLYGEILDRTTGERVEVKRTFSDILKLIEAIVALVQEYVAKLTAVPAPDPADWIEELTTDQDYLDILEEIEIYRQLRPREEYKNLYHPMICFLRKTLYSDGVAGLMKRETQLEEGDPNHFEDRYDPTVVVKTPYPIQDVDFDSDGSYSSYNWELFYHAPLMIAMRLSKDQKFEEALEWFHYMFNPTGVLSGTVPQKYWVTKPFYQHTADDYLEQRIDNLLYKIADPNTAERAELEFAIAEWRENPFMPHTVARFRHVAYQKALLMKYLDNLISWGDFNFGQDTMESIAQATQYYILAEKLLGSKPRTIPSPVTVPSQTYYQIENSLQDFGNALVEFENIVPDLTLLPEGGAELPPAPITLSSLYFCVPQNEKMLEYWDTIEDRLFKIRNCQNIDGVERTLALFAPPIDPGMLVRAAAAGLSLSSILAGMGAPLPHYRFERLAAKATELIQEVRSLGTSLLQALEKKDAEELTLLRNDLELKVLKSTREMKLLQISESEEQIEVLNKNRLMSEERNTYYANIEEINANEQLNLDKLSEAHNFQLASSIVRATGGVLGLIPDFSFGGHGAGGSPAIHATFGGSNLAEMANAAAGVLDIFSTIASFEASRAGTLGGYDRRNDDWALQERVTSLEMDHIDQQIVAAEIRKEIAEADLASHDQQIENNEKTDEFMRDKYTNKELYSWMVNQITSVYFKAYKLAYDMTKKAEKCYQHELGSTDTFMEFGYWDSMKKGLQAADHMFHDLKRMEVSYLDKNKREYELTKHVSLSHLDPLALVRLRATGVCDFEIPEALYDMDHPGHYFRRIKSISISLPCIAGPYTSVSGKLSELSNKYRKTTAKAAGAATPKEEYEEAAGGDTRFTYNVGTIQSVATSNGQNDSGLFQLDFRDERYLPFEGTGAISSWRFELPSEVQQFDYQSITDLIIHVKYTAREGGSSLKTLAEDTLVDKLKEIQQDLSKTGMHSYHSLRYEMPNEWNLLKTTGTSNVTVTKSLLPYFVQPLTPAIEEVVFIARVNGNPATFTIALDGTDLPLPKNVDLELCLDVSSSVSLDSQFVLSSADASLDDLEDLVMVVKYSF